MRNPTPKGQPDIFTPFIYPVSIKQKLEIPNSKFNKDFLSVVTNRRSDKDFAGLSISEIAELLYWSNKIQSFQVDEIGFILSKRTSPSAGARHPVDILVSPAATNRQLSYYNPIDHTLRELLIAEQKLNDFLNEISKNISIRNACIFWFSIQHEKTGSKYENPESLYWKDTGALLYCIQLIATYLGYKSCPLGTLATTSFNNLFNSSKIISGGGILLGK